MWKGAGGVAARAGGLLAILLIAVLGCTVDAAQGPALRAGAPSIIDTHNHLFGVFPAGPGQVAVDYEGAAQVALETMDRLGIKTLIVMPPPFAPGHPHAYDADALLDVVRRRPDRFALLAGGGSLNPMLHQAARDGDAGPEVRRRFEQKALEILSKGALGFGEMTANISSFVDPAPVKSMQLFTFISSALQYNAILEFG